jgi:hypothetical protein
VVRLWSAQAKTCTRAGSFLFARICVALSATTCTIFFMRLCRTLFIDKPFLRLSIRLKVNKFCISCFDCETLVISRMAGQLFALNGLWMVC